VGGLARREGEVHGGDERKVASLCYEAG
jgi:hypothetical protein